MKKSISVTIDTELLKRLDRKLVREGRNRSKVIGLILERWVREEEA